MVSAQNYVYHVTSLLVHIRATSSSTTEELVEETWCYLQEFAVTWKCFVKGGCCGMSRTVNQIARRLSDNQS